MSNNKNLEKLEQLISLKKTRKSSTASERDEFSAAWLALVGEEQFSERAEKFLYDGFTYCGARPFAEYMQKSEDQAAILDCLCRGKLYGRNCAGTCQILFHLLAISLNDENITDKVVARLIERIPGAMVNKEGKAYGQADRCFRKNFLEVLEPTAELPEFRKLAAFGLAREDFDNFAAAVDGIIAKTDPGSLSEACRMNVARVNRWLHPAAETGQPDAAGSEAASGGRDETAGEGEAGGHSGEEPKREAEGKLPQGDERKGAPAGADGAGVDLETQKDAEAALEDERNRLRKSADEARSEIRFLKKENTGLRDEIDADEKMIDLLKKERERLKSNLLEKEGEISKLLRGTVELRERNAVMTRRLERNEEDIAKLVEMLDMLRRDRAKQSDETVKRIGARLRTYYTDYKEALGLEMSPELGENMRDQIGEIFRILSSAGIVFR